MTEVVRAKRGMAVVIVRHDVEWRVDGPRVERKRIDIGVVTSVSRTGEIRAVLTAWSDQPQRVDRMAGRPALMTADGVPAEDALRVAREHHWPAHPNQPRSFDSLDEVRAALAPWRRSC